jgi:phage terminase large subunit-like protein
VRHAAERHLRDLRDARSRGYFWRPELAQRALDFFPAVFTITDGPAAGKPFNLIPYQTFCVGSLMGWVNADGRWRFRQAWLETGKGQAKSPLMAGLGLYAMGWCDFERSQVYSIAANKQTANVLFKDAAAMCRAQIPGYDDGESLVARGDVVLRGELDNAWKIEHPGRARSSSRSPAASSNPVRGRGWSWPTRSTNSRPTRRSRPGSARSPRSPAAP